MSGSEREKEITNIVSVLDKTPAKQHVGVIIKTGLGYVPVVGGLLGALYFT